MAKNLASKIWWQFTTINNKMAIILFFLMFFFWPLNINIIISKIFLIKFFNKKNVRHNLFKSFIKSAIDKSAIFKNKKLPLYFFYGKFFATGYKKWQIFLEVKRLVSFNSFFLNIQIESNNLIKSPSPSRGFLFFFLKIFWNNNI